MSGESNETPIKPLPYGGEQAIEKSQLQQAAKHLVRDVIKEHGVKEPQKETVAAVTPELVKKIAVSIIEGAPPQQTQDAITVPAKKTEDEIQRAVAIEQIRQDIIKATKEMKQKERSANRFATMRKKLQNTNQ